MDAEAERLLVEFVEKVGLLRRDMQHRQELDRYEARVNRIEQKLVALVNALSASNPSLAKALETAWKLPARSLAFRNVEHQKEGS
ncbi:MAG: hypothetical protein ABL986_03695 [Vicinamibacterales bacterium]